MELHKKYLKNKKMKQIYLKTKIIIIILFFVFISKLSFSQTTLSAGDIAFIGFHADDQDGFTFIMLKDISANTVIYFTSQGWDGSNTTWYTGNGGHFSWTAPPGGLTTGTIVYITETAADLLNASSGTMSSLLAGNAWAVASSGDQILAYQSSTGASPVSPSFITAVDADYYNSYDGADGWTTSYDVNTIGYASYVPPGLTNGVNCVALANASQTIEYDNFKYTGTLSGTTTEVRTAINTYNNWTGNNSAIDISVSAYSTPNITTPAVAPTVTTHSVSNISATTATGNGTITSTGNANISERGIYWSTIDGFTDGTGTKVSTTGDWGATGDFTQDITELEPNTPYYVKAFATNSAGTGYGSQVSFTTSAPADPYSQLYWGTYETDKIERINLDGTGKEDVVTNASGVSNYGVIGFSVDIPNEKVYWFEDANMSIKSANLDGSNVQTVATGVGWSYSVAVDNKNNKLYWTDYEGDKIVRSDLDGSNAETAISSASGVSNYGPIGMTVDELNGKIYWFEDANMSVKCANLDGSNLQIIASGTGWVYSISVDSKNNKLYWTDYEGDKIVQSDLDGGNAITAISSASGVTSYGPIGMTIDVINEKVYWFEDANFTIKRANTDGTGVETFQATDGWVYTLDIPYELPYSTLPSVSTTVVSIFDESSATLGGEVTSDGGATVTERGIVYSTTDATPTIGEIGVTQDQNGDGTGTFSKSITGLTAGTLYYVCAYATNSAGTNYGSIESFTTGIGELEWDGSESNDWGLAENWTPSIIPTAGYNVTIPAGLTNYPTLSSDGVCNNLTVESNASSTGSLIGQSYLTVNGITNIERYLTGVDKWHLISAPLEGQGINDLVVTNLAENAVAAIAPKYGLAPYNNSTPGWNHYTTPSGTNDIVAAGNFIPGKGYEVLRTADGTITFNGTLSTSDVDIAISKNANGWNLVGNPYPSAINGANIGTNFLSTNASAIDDNYEAIYVWDAANSNYITINYTSGATYVALGQAFFVYSVEGGSVINFNETMQTHQTGNIFKSGEVPAPTIKLIAERSQGISATKVLYLENATTGLDAGYDAGRFSAGNNSFAVYTHLAGDITSLVDFDIQCLPAFDFSNVIPVGLNAPANTNVVFHAETLNLPLSTPVILEDRLTGNVTDLTVAGSTYEINITEKTEGTGRFFLHTKKMAATGINPGSGETDFMIIPHLQSNSLHVSGNMGNKAEIAVYDMLGRKLIQDQLTSDGFNEVKMDGFKSGTYVVFIQSSTQKISKKISWIKK
jgi:hypothetical protein